MRSKNQQSFQQCDIHVKEYFKHKEIEKNKHHISWKNHNIDQYINKAIENYLTKGDSK